MLIRAAFGRPKLVIALALLVLASLAGTMTYTGVLVVGLLAEYLGTGRFVAGLLLGAVFARFPWISQGKLRIVGLLPQAARRPCIVGLLALCCSSFVWRGAYVPAAFIGVTTVFVVAYPWLKRAIFNRVLSSVFKSPAGQQRRSSIDDNVIDGEFRERKE